MPPRRRPGFVLLALAAAAGPVAGQTVDLTDAAKPGECVRYELTLAIDGKMKVDRDGKPDSLPLKARATHAFVERAEAVDARGVGRAVRWYQTATSESEVGFDRGKRELAADRRLIAARRTPTVPLHFSPDGPLSRDDLELVAEHFDTLSVPAFLPNRTVAVGDTWAVPADAVRAACQFERLINGELTGKLVGTADGVAAFTVTGTAEGIEAGARAVVTVTAAGKFNVAAKRLTELTWEQTDDREQGPASPAAEVKASLTLKRTPLTTVPAELGAAALAKVPAGDTVPDALLQLRYADGEGRYRFTYGRDWRLVGRTRDHLVLRLVEAGEFTAQATLTDWKKADPGRHTGPDEFKAAVARLPGWEPDAALADGPVPAADGHWAYRFAARGKQDGAPVVQIFYLLAGPNGDQLAVTVVARAEAAAKLGGRDLALVRSVEFPARK